MLTSSQVTMASPITVTDRTDNRTSSLTRLPVALPASGAAGKHRQQRKLEQYIHAVFSRAYAADVHHFLPLLVGIREPGGEYIAAAGLQPAAMNTLYLENYLDRPIDEILSDRMQLNINRGQIIEAGNLAVTNRGGARHLITALLAYLYHAGYQWAVFTAVPLLINNFRKLGLPLTKLADADPRRLGAEAVHWGRYYDFLALVPVCRCVVVAGHIPTGFHLLQQRERSLQDPDRYLSSQTFIYRSKHDASQRP